MGKKHDLNELYEDPEPLDEDDQELWEDSFQIHKALGSKPEDLRGASQEFRQAYAEWLKTSQEEA